MASSVTCLPFKYEELNSISRTHIKKLAWHRVPAYNLSAGGRGGGRVRKIPEACGHPGLAELANSRFSEQHCLKKKMV